MHLHSRRYSCVAANACIAVCKRGSMAKDLHQHLLGFPIFWWSCSPWSKIGTVQAGEKIKILGLILESVLARASKQEFRELACLLLHLRLQAFSNVYLPDPAAPVTFERAAWEWFLDSPALYIHAYSLNFEAATPSRNWDKGFWRSERLLEIWSCYQNPSFLLGEHFFFTARLNLLMQKLSWEIIGGRLSQATCPTSATTLVAIPRPYILLAAFCKGVCMPSSVLAFAFCNMGMWQLCTWPAFGLRFWPSWFPKVCGTWGFICSIYSTPCFLNAPTIC